MAGDEPVAVPEEAEAVAPPRRRSAGGRIVRWTFGLLAALLLLLVAGVLILNSPIGGRFIAAEIAKKTFPNGLNIQIGRIEGNLYGAAVLHDVRLSDPKGVFLTIPRAEIDWNPAGWLNNRLDIHSFAARRATMARVPEFLPSTEEKPILPSFDIAIDKLAIDNLTLAPGIAGATAQRVDVDGKALVEDGRLMVQANGQFGRRDRLVFDIDAHPDGNDFRLALDVDAAANGPLAAMAGIDQPYVARLRGQGAWTNWNGSLLARSGERRVAALKIGNRSGRFRVLGLVDPSDFVTGTAARALGTSVALGGDIKVDQRVFSGKVNLFGKGVVAKGQGAVDLAQNRADNLLLDLSLADPALFGDTFRIEGGKAQARLDGPFGDLTIVHDVRVAKLVAGTSTLEGLRQQGTARWDEKGLVLPLAVTAARVRSGQPWLDPRLVNGTARGRLTLAGTRLAGEDLRIAFPGLSATLALGGDTARGTYRLAGPVRAQGLKLDNVGTVGGTAVIDLAMLPDAPFRLAAKLDGRVSPVSNATLANLAGPSIRVAGALATGGNAPLRFNGLRVTAAKLNLALNGQVREGTTTLAGRGSHVDYGPFTVEARIAGGKPAATLVFARPTSWADNVRLAIAPEGDAFAIAATGGSVLGPFDGALTLLSPAGGATTINIDRMKVSDTSVTGAIALESGGARGNLALSGGGLDGTVALAPRDGGQGLAVALTARQARFGGATPLTIARADIRGEGLLREGHTSFSGEGTAQGLNYGSLFIGRLAAKGAINDGTGRIDASLSGRRGSRFDLDLNALVSPDSYALAARGEYAGRTISTPRRVVLTREDGGWSLAPAYLQFGRGGVVAEGRIGGGATDMTLKLAQMPLGLLDIVNGDLGLGGSVSGIVEYRQASGGLPAGTARVKIDDLTRSGLVLTSKPIDVSLLATLDSTSLTAQAKVGNPDIKRGRLSARIDGLPQAGALGERVRAGRLDARLSYSGAAESLWRLAAIDAFDIAGPLALSAQATGSIADPRVRGAVSSDALRISSSIAGTDIRDGKVRGRFEGSRLNLLRLEGKAGDGTVAGSGSIDLAGLGERVEGNFVENRGPSIDLKVSARNARLLNAAGIDATLTGPLRIVSNGLGGTIAGRVSVDRASWRLGTAAESEKLPRIATREINIPGDRASGAASSRPWRYLIDARADDRIEVDGMGLDSEWSANVRLRGTTDDPRVGGTARMVRGDYSFAGTTFELTRGEIAFDPGGPIDPRLDIRAETDVPGLNVIVQVQGSATTPEITFNSTPSLPEEEILARLLFGGSITTLSATDALQLGAALASLRGGGGLDPINRLRTAIGLDRLRIVSADPALGRGTGIALGKNITRRLYAEIITDGRGYSATNLEFRVTSWLSLLASISTVGRESVVAEISRDY